jgi:hypothetical protein
LVPINTNNGPFVHEGCTVEDKENVYMDLISTSDKPLKEAKFVYKNIYDGQNKFYLSETRG